MFLFTTSCGNTFVGGKCFYSPRAVGTPLSEVNVFIHHELWEHLCRRYMRSTECGNTFVGGTCALPSVGTPLWEVHALYRVPLEFTLCFAELNLKGLALNLVDRSPSMLQHSWLVHLTHKIVPKMTYNVSSGC